VDSPPLFAPGAVLVAPPGAAAGGDTVEAPTGVGSVSFLCTLTRFLLLWLDGLRSRPRRFGQPPPRVPWPLLRALFRESLAFAHACAAWRLTVAREWSDAVLGCISVGPAGPTSPAACVASSRIAAATIS